MTGAVWGAAFALPGSGGPDRAAAAEALGPGFTYQGLLRLNGANVSDACDFAFSLWDDANGGTQIGTTQTVTALTVTDGLFSVELNGGGEFGAGAFNGEARWLDIAVRCPPAVGYTPLSPRQPLTTAPYALYALNGPGAGSTPWEVSGGDIYRESGRVGIGTASPAFRLDVRAPAPRAIFGWATNASGTTYGVVGQNASTEGTGVLGNSTADSGNTTGVLGFAESPTGKGVYGFALDSNGLNYGVYGKTNSDSGYAGYFEGRGYFSDGLGVGVVGPAAPLHVRKEPGDSRPAVMVETRSGAQLVQSTTIEFDGNAIDARFNQIASNLRLNPNSSGDVLLGLGGGSVGVNEVVPEAKLHVVGASNISPEGGGLFIVEHGPSGIQVAVDGNEIQARNAGAASSLHLNARGGNMTLVQNGAGNVGIGTNSPDYPLDVETDSASLAVRANNTNTGANGFLAGQADGRTVGAYGEGEVGVRGVAAEFSDWAGWFSGAVVIDGRLDVDEPINASTINASNINVSNDIDVDDDLSVGGDITADGLLIHGDAGIGDKLVAVRINTALLIGGLKLFQIDHPLQPETHYLHASVESDQPLTTYSGNVVLNSAGQAVVQLPSWFQALNIDYRYQLTCIGAFANVYIAQEIGQAGPNQFRMAGGFNGLKVSWKVDAVRNDKFIQQNPLVVEPPKETTPPNAG